MSGLRLGLIFCGLFLGHPSVARAQDAVNDIPKPSMDAQIFEFKNGADYTWHRPPEVRFVLINGCGGGGGGTWSRRAGDEWGAGDGGSAAPMQTVLIPVTADKYEIHLGDGGGSGAQGGSSTVSGGGVTVSFPSGLAGRSGQRSGESSALGTGGALGGRRQPGGNASGYCAGGGGGGAGRGNTPGGNGAPGRVAILPMPDMARFARVLAMIENLSAPPAPPEEPTPPEEETTPGDKLPEQPVPEQPL